MLTRGPVGAHLRALTVPMIWGILTMMTFNVVDTWFVARLGPRELAAMSFTFPVVMTLMSVAIGLGAGTSSVLARAIGEANTARSRRLATDSLILASLSVAVLTLLGLLTIDPVFRLLGAPDDLLPLIRRYMLPWYAGLAFLIVPMVGMASIRATGNTQTPSRIMIVASVLNIIIDPILIFGLAGFPRLELAGAAYATLIARATTLIAALWVLHHRLQMLSWDAVKLGELRASWAGILHVGLPAAGTNVIIPVANGVIVAMVAGFGTAAVAGLGVATRIEAFSLVIFYAMSAIIGPFVGQNLGAGRRDRILEALKLSFVFCLGFGALLALTVGICAVPLATFFTDDPAVVHVAALYLWIVPLSYGTAGIIMIVNACFNGLGKPLPATMISVTRMVIVYVPLAYLGKLLWGVPGIFAAAACSNLLIGAGAALWGELVCRRTPQGPGHREGARPTAGAAQAG
jgi:putative MATE family efflux protein